MTPSRTGKTPGRSVSAMMNLDDVLYIKPDGTSVRIPRRNLPPNAQNKNYVIGISFYDGDGGDKVLGDMEELEVWAAPGVGFRPLS